MVVASELIGDDQQDVANTCVLAGIRQIIVLAPIQDANEASYVSLPMLHGVIKRPWRQSRLLDDLMSTLEPQRPRPVTARLTKSQRLVRQKPLFNGQQNAKKPGNSEAQVCAEGADRVDSAAADVGLPKVLLVEDSRVNQKIAAIMLKKSGLQVETALNGREALSRSEQEQFTLIFMDCQMPEMDGFEATRALRSGQHGNVATPIIALTANAMLGDRERCVSSGMSDYLSKPVTQERMSEMVERWLGQTHG